MPARPRRLRKALGRDDPSTAHDRCQRLRFDARPRRRLYHHQFQYAEGFDRRRIAEHRRLSVINSSTVKVGSSSDTLTLSGATISGGIVTIASTDNRREQHKRHQQRHHQQFGYAGDRGTFTSWTTPRSMAHHHRDRRRWQPRHQYRCRRHADAQWRQRRWRDGLRQRHRYGRQCRNDPAWWRVEPQQYRLADIHARRYRNRVARRQNDKADERGRDAGQRGQHDLGDRSDRRWQHQPPSSWTTTPGRSRRSAGR